MFFTQKKTDLLAAKQEELVVLTRDSEAAIDIVTSTITNLTNLNVKIDATVDEINNTIAQFSTVVDDLNTKKTRNAKVIAKFKNLLED